MIVIISTEVELRAVAAACLRIGSAAKVFLKVRHANEHGLFPDDIWPLCSFIAAMPFLTLGGLVTVDGPGQAELLRSLSAYCAQRAVHIPELILASN